MKSIQSVILVLSLLSLAVLAQDNTTNANGTVTCDPTKSGSCANKVFGILDACCATQIDNAGTKTNFCMSNAEVNIRNTTGNVTNNG